MKYFVFAVGGTGARCLESLIYLCAMGLGPKTLHPFLVDPDIGNGNLSRTTELIKSYKAIRSKMANPTEGSLFYTDISFELTDQEGGNTAANPNMFNPNSKLLRGQNTLAHFIEYNTKLSSETGTKLLADLLFSKDELDMDMTQGYRGIPSIGSILMTTIKDDPLWTSLITTLKEGRGSKVFVFASVFGGTGASGYPVISQMIRKECPEPEIGGALILPYFTLIDPQNLMATRQDMKEEKILPNSSSFLMNAKAACEYYYNNFSKVNSNYVLGDDLNLSKPYENYEIGSKGQKNDAHIVELLAAYAAIDFWEKPKEEHRAFYCLGAENPKSDTDKVWGITDSDLPHSKKVLPLEKFALIHLYLTEIKDLIEKSKPDDLDKIAWLRKLNFRGQDILDQQDSLKPLFALSDSFKVWIKQMHKNSAELDIFNDDLWLDYLLAKNPDKYRGFPISRMDKALFIKPMKKNNLVDSIITTLSQAKIVKGGN